jgi:hypothetical protein
MEGGLHQFQFFLNECGKLFGRLLPTLRYRSFRAAITTRCLVYERMRCGSCHNCAARSPHTWPQSVAAAQARESRAASIFGGCPEDPAGRHISATQYQQYAWRPSRQDTERQDTDVHFTSAHWQKM